MLQVVGVCFVILVALTTENNAKCIKFQDRTSCVPKDLGSTSSALTLDQNDSHSVIKRVAINNEILFTNAPTSVEPEKLPSSDFASSLFTSGPLTVESNQIPGVVPLSSEKGSSEKPESGSDGIFDIFTSASGPSTTPEKPESNMGSIVDVFTTVPPGPTSELDNIATSTASLQTGSDVFPRQSDTSTDISSSTAAFSEVTEASTSTTDAIFYPVTVPVLQTQTSTSSESFTGSENSNTFADTSPAISVEPSTTIASTVKPIVVSINKLIPDKTVCGFQNESDRFPDFPIASLDEFPWMALLRYRYKDDCDAGFRCAGTLISDRYVLTAAHCVLTEGEQYTLDGVRLGEWSLSSDKDCDFDNEDECTDKVVDLKIENTIVHPDFSPRFRNDNIALLRLEKSVKYSIFIRPICLPVEKLVEPEDGTVLITSGWGANKHGIQNDIKSKIYVPVIAKDHCRSPAYSRTKFFLDQSCFGISKQEDFCKVDAGGPLMAVDQGDKPQWYLEGIISRGYGCNIESIPGVYTRVTTYVNWILQTIAYDII